MNRLSTRLGGLLMVLGFGVSAFAGDWPVWRGPYQNGVSLETGLPGTTKDILWRWPYGGHSTPVIVKGRVYGINLTGKKVIVKINDVGPLTPGRIIDLNERTMRHFDPSLERGVIPDVIVKPLFGDYWVPGPVG